MPGGFPRAGNPGGDDDDEEDDEPDVRRGEELYAGGERR